MASTIVTGASRGLGLALASELARRGRRLVIDARGEDELEAARARLAAATEVVALPGDVATEAHRRALIAAAGPEIELLVEAGFDVVAQAGDADDLLRKALAHDPGALVADVQMPPGRSDDGLRAAIELRRQHPDTGVLVLSQVYEEHYAMDLLGDRPEGAGYLLKERVGDMEEFIHAVRRVAHRRVLAVLTYLRNATS